MAFWTALGNFAKTAGEGLLKNIPAIGSMLQSHLDAKQSRENIRDQQAHQMEMAEYQYSKDLEQWERSNLYNHPSQQMARLKEAGLNPAMIYGSGGAKTVATQSPKYQAPRPDYSGRLPQTNLPQAISLYQDFQMKSAQIDTARAERDIKELYRNWMLTKRNFKTEGGTVTMRPNWGALYDTQLQIQKNTMDRIAKESGVRGLDMSLKQFEVDWWKMLKGTGQLGKVGLPFLRMLLGR